MIGILIGSVFLAAGLLAADWRKSAVPRDEIRRNSYGGGDRSQIYTVTDEETKKEAPVEITVGEKQYTAQEMQGVFQRAVQQMEILALGKNESAEKVVYDMNLITEIPDEPITVEWTTDRADVMNVNGELKEEEIEQEKNGVLVNLEACLTYTEDETKQAVHGMTVKVYPREKNLAEALQSGIQKEIENGNKAEEIIKLPDEIEGRKLSYHYPMDFRGISVLFVGISVSILLFYLDKQERKKRKEDRGRQMLRDYPEIINQLTLLLGAGMTSKRAWQKIVEDYRKKKEEGERRFAYEEMEISFHEMQSGVTEKECYERFGRRCGVSCYMKLGALLSQNVRKGTKGITDLLKVEAIHAFDERKARAKRLGEEAGTKLLLPMFFMLAVVLVIVIVPAFLSIQI